jgi:hypothetical protein
MRNSVRVRVATAVLVASLTPLAVPAQALGAQRSPGGGVARGSIVVTAFRSTTEATAPDGTKFEDNIITQTYTGDVMGHGPLISAEILRPNGDATFVGSEFIACRLAGRNGTLLLTDVGTVRGAVVRGTWKIVGGLGGLTGISGRGSFVANLGKGATYVLRFHFPA